MIGLGGYAARCRGRSRWARSWRSPPTSAQLVGPARLIGALIVSAQLTRAGVERVYDLIDSEPEVTDPPQPRALPDGPLPVELDDVRFGYTDTAARSEPVLDGLSLTVAPGETLALVGPPGSGKSTVALLLPRFYDPQSGALRLGGVDLRELRLHDLRAELGVVFEEAFLFSDTIRANIAYGRPDATDDEIRAAAACRADRRVRRGAAGGLRDRGRRARPDAVRRAAAADRARPRAAHRPAGAGARRRDVRGGHRDRGRHPRHAARADRRPDDAAGRAPAVHAGAGRPGRGARPRAGRRRRHRGRAARAVRAVPGAARDRSAVRRGPACGPGHRGRPGACGARRRCHRDRCDRDRRRGDRRRGGRRGGERCRGKRRRRARHRRRPRPVHPGVVAGRVPGRVRGRDGDGDHEGHLRRGRAAGRRGRRGGHAGHARAAGPGGGAAAGPGGAAVAGRVRPDRPRSGFPAREPAAPGTG